MPVPAHRALGGVRRLRAEPAAVLANAVGARDGRARSGSAPRRRGRAGVGGGVEGVEGEGPSWRRPPTPPKPWSLPPPAPPSPC